MLAIYKEMNAFMIDISLIHNRKVAIIGTGNVGASIAYALTIRNLAREIVLIDKDEGRAAGEALDIQHGIPYMGVSSVYSGSYIDCSNCDLIIITAGRKRKVGETRLDLARENISIIEDVVAKIQPYYTRGAIMMVANPVDILTYKCAELMGLPDGRVFGKMGHSERIGADLYRNVPGNYDIRMFESAVSYFRG